MEKRLFKLETFQVPVKSTDPAGRQVTAEKIAATLLLYKGVSFLTSPPSHPLRLISILSTHLPSFYSSIVDLTRLDKG